PLPIGTLDADTIDPNAEDEDEDSILTAEDLDDSNGDDEAVSPEEADNQTRATYQRRAQASYEMFAVKYKQRFKWLRPSLFTARLKKQLREDADQLLEVLAICGDWQPANDTKLAELKALIGGKHR